MPELTYVNVFAEDVEALSRFYIEVFDFAEIPEIRSPIFRGVSTGKSSIGFNAHEAYALLKLDDEAETKGVKFLLNIDVDSAEDVDRLVPIAVKKGASLVKDPGKTYYNWYQAVLRDPEGNVFRINKILS
jgi:predicted lactoylglutathione lyase